MDEPQVARPYKTTPLSTSGSIVVFGMLLGICLFSLSRGPGILSIFLFASKSLYGLVLYAAMALLMYLEYFMLKRSLGDRPIRFKSGLLMIIGLVDLFFLEMFIPYF